MTRHVRRQCAALGSCDNTICVWGAETGKVVTGPLKGHNGSVLSVAYSPDGKHIVSGSDDETICVWDVQTGQVVTGPLKGHNHSVRSVAYSPDAKHIVSGSLDKTICVWDAETGQVVTGPLKGHNDHVLSVAYSPDGKHIVSGSGDTTICIWDVQAGQVATGHSKELNVVTSSLNDQHNVSGSSENLVIPVVGKPTCDHHNNPLPPTIGPYCVSCTWGFPNNSTIHDGWISGPNSELIFWVPHRNRDALLMPSMIQKMGVPLATKLTFDHFVQGDSWTKCLTQC